MPRFNGVVTLAGFDFTDFAIPESVRSSGPYGMNIHKQPGGARQIDMMGNDPDPFEWSGLLLGPTAQEALDNMAYLEELKVAGDPVVLNYGGMNGDTFEYDVVIADLSFNYLAPAMIEYRIKCVPIVNGDNAGANGNPAPPGANGAGTIPAGP